VCHSKHVKPSNNGGIINSITRLHLVGYFSQSLNTDQRAETCHAASTVKECLSELVCGFFKNTVGSSNYKMLNDAMKNKQEKMWKEVAVAHSTVPALN
jgi:hypothetical protein